MLNCTEKRLTTCINTTVVAAACRSFLLEGSAIICNGILAAEEEPARIDHWSLERRMNKLTNRIRDRGITEHCGFM